MGRDVLSTMPGTWQPLINGDCDYLKIEQAGSTEVKSNKARQSSSPRRLFCIGPRISRAPSKCRCQDDALFVFCPVFKILNLCIGIPRADPHMANDSWVPAFSQMSYVLESKIWPELYYSENCPAASEAVTAGV